jgi:hypothetical protein
VTSQNDGGHVPAITGLNKRKEYQKLIVMAAAFQCSMTAAPHRIAISCAVKYRIQQFVSSAPMVNLNQATHTGTILV